MPRRPRILAGTPAGVWDASADVGRLARSTVASGLLARCSSLTVRDATGEKGVVSATVAGLRSVLGFMQYISIQTCDSWLSHSPRARNTL